MAHNVVSIEISEVRKRVRAAIEQSRRDGAARRAEVEEANAAYERFLKQLAGPLVQMLANALRGEGIGFAVFTPKAGLRLASSRSADDYIEFALDTTGRHPIVMLRVKRGRGSRIIQHERPVRGEEQVDQLTEEDVLKALLEELGPLVER